MNATPGNPEPLRIWDEIQPQAGKDHTLTYHL
jgi:hypothetical protein